MPLVHTPVDTTNSQPFSRYRTKTSAANVIDGPPATPAVGRADGDVSDRLQAVLRPGTAAPDAGRYTVSNARKNYQDSGQIHCQEAVHVLIPQQHTQTRR